MIKEFIVYPHEICWRPSEVVGHCYQVADFVTDYSDNFTFRDSPLGEGFQKIHHDEFDEMCKTHEGAILHVKGILKDVCDSFIDSLGCGEYAFVLHNADSDDDGGIKKPHFHVLFILPNKVDVSNISIYDLLGMYKYVRNDFEKRGKKYQSFKRSYPSQLHSRCYEYLDYMRSERLRYLCHLDNVDKHTYSLSDVVASFNYVDDPDVITLGRLSPFAVFLGFKNKFKLNDEVDWFEWLASAKLNDNIRDELKSIKTDIHRYYIALYYRGAKKIW